MFSFEGMKQGTGQILSGRTQERVYSLAQSVEHAAVNRSVVGSSPTGGA